MHLSNRNPLNRKMRPNSNKVRAGNFVPPSVGTGYNPSPLYKICHSYRIHRNKPLFLTPVYFSVVKFRGYGHTHCVQWVKTTDKNKKFHYKKKMIRIIIKSFITVPNPKNDCLRFRSVSLHLGKGSTPAPLQRLIQVVQRLLDDS